MVFKSFPRFPLAISFSLSPHRRGQAAQVLQRRVKGIKVCEDDDEGEDIAKNEKDDI
jgi:hypothetical protein